MKHPISDSDWIAYLEDGALPDSERKRIERHLHSCDACRETAELMRAVDDALVSAGASLRSAVPVTPAAIAIARQKTLARLGADLPLRLGNLYWLLVPMCGNETSARAILIASNRVSADSPWRLEERLWPGFVRHLRTIVATLCGEPAAQLVWERGMSLHQQEAA
ncbi:MAG TPA: zf-HC2 domain-containing protein [Bryobacteraceae bacterium]|jgi:anti-sigma factor RsiW